MSSAIAQPRVLVDTISTAWVRNAAMIVAATAFIAASAQVAIPLPFTPVPLTGQTFAVLVACAALGVWRSVLSTGLYLVAAFAGLPVLAPQADGSHITGTAVASMASLGYVLGFIVAAIVVGRLAEAGFTRTPMRTAVAMVAGNLTIYAVGVPVLQAVTGADFATAVAWGLTPFLIGDLIKVVLAAGLLPSVWALVQRFAR